MELNTQCLMGMSEMESAIRVMWNRVSEDINPVASFTKLRVRADWFTCDPQTLTGFCHLCCRGWIVPTYPNWDFAVSSELTARIALRVGNSLPLDGHIDHRLSFRDKAMV